MTRMLSTICLFALALSQQARPPRNTTKQPMTFFIASEGSGDGGNLGGLAGADRICDKLKSSSGQLSFQDMLVEIRSLFALSSQAHAQKYFDFWDAIINRRQSAPLPMAAAGGR